MRSEDLGKSWVEREGIRDMTKTDPYRYKEGKPGDKES